MAIPDTQKTIQSWRELFVNARTWNLRLCAPLLADRGAAGADFGSDHPARSPLVT
jgi:hypothetical protein